MKRFASSFGGWFALAAALHAALLFARWSFLASDAAYGVAPLETVEISLVEAAPAAVEAPPAPPEPPPPAPPQPTPEPAPVPPPAPSPEPAPAVTPRPAPPAPRPKRAATPSAVARPGAVAGTVAGTTAPAYLFNPHPPYPPESRSAREQGVVLLSVAINERGEVTAISVKRSSGFARLDSAALAGVRRWRFKPARLAGLPITAKIDIPVRFQLDR